MKLIGIIQRLSSKESYAEELKLALAGEVKQLKEKKPLSIPLQFLIPRIIAVIPNTGMIVTNAPS